jgi:uncharacterized membrane protein
MPATPLDAIGIQGLSSKLEQVFLCLQLGGSLVPDIASLRLLVKVQRERVLYPASFLFPLVDLYYWNRPTINQ